MTIVHESDLAVVHHADARDIRLDTESVDLVVTDPPYGIDYQSNMRAEQFALIANDADQHTARPVVATVLTDCVRVVGQNRHLYVFGTDDVDPLDGLKVSERTRLIWDKQRNGMGDLSAVWSQSHETIWFAVSKHRHAGQRDKSNLAVRLRRQSVLPFHPKTGRTLRHPTEKPLPLLAELIESSSRVGELVYDPFAGAGSTGVAAILAGRRCVLVEENADHAATAVERIRAAEALRAQMAAA